MLLLPHARLQLQTLDGVLCSNSTAVQYCAEKVYLAAGLGLEGGVGNIVNRHLLARLVPQSELGKVYGLLAMLDAALPFIGENLLQVLHIPLPAVHSLPAGDPAVRRHPAPLARRLLPAQRRAAAGPRLLLPRRPHHQQSARHSTVNIRENKQSNNWNVMYV